MHVDAKAEKLQHTLPITTTEHRATVTSISTSAWASQA